MKRLLLSALVAVSALALIPLVKAQGTATLAQTPQNGFPRISLPVGRSRILTTDFDITRIAVTNPTVADAVAVEPRQILIDAKAAGTISLIIWGADTRLQYDVNVEGNVSPLQTKLLEIFPGEDIRVTASDEVIVLTGRVSTNQMAIQAAQIAQASSSKSKVVNLLRQPNETDTQQVMLQVRFADITRSAGEELGVALLSARNNLIGRTTTGQFTLPGNPIVDEGRLVWSDWMNLFFYSPQEAIGAVIKALEERKLLQILAEPNLMAYNGQEASFLAGGEFPVPIVNANNGAINVEYKEFGVRLTFTPILSGDLIRLKVKPEVSTIDSITGVNIGGGFPVPVLSTRRAETEVELRDGQSFAIAGLLNNQSSQDKQMIPVLSALPIIGSLFKSKSESQERRELLVLITPHLVRPYDPANVPPMPGDPSLYLQPTAPKPADKPQGQ